jgi:hypothetical protein
MDTHIFLPEGDGSCQQAIMGHGSSTTHKNVRDMDLARWCIQGCGTSVMHVDDILMANNFLAYIFLNLFQEHS